MLVKAPANSAVLQDAAEYFDARWHNRPNRRYSHPYAAHARDGWLRYWRYRLMEATGLSTF